MSSQNIESNRPHIHDFIQMCVVKKTASEIAKGFNVPRMTFYKWLEDPEFQEAWDMINEYYIDIVIDMLKQTPKGREFIERSKK